MASVLLWTTALVMVASAWAQYPVPPLPDTTPAKGPLASTVALDTTTTAPASQAPPATTTKKPPRTRKPRPGVAPVDFDCKHKRAGYYPDPKDKCSSKYYACVGGVARQMACPLASLVYEPETKSCERPEDSFRCSGVRKSTPLPTSARTPAPTSPLPLDCSARPDGWYAHPDKCSHLFFSCSNGIAAQFKCPGNMFFDQPASMCMAREDVEACGGKRPPATTPASPPPPTTPLPIDCADKPTGYYPDPLAKCSSTYYACSGGAPSKLTCPGGTSFDKTTGRCEFPDEVVDCGGKPKPPTKATPRPSPASLPPPEFDCTGKPDGGYTPEDKKCSHVFYKCLAGSSFRFVCPNDLYYDISNDLCDHFANLFVCSNRPPTTRLPTTTQAPKPTPKIPIDCSKLDDGDYPDPVNKCCSIYYSCSGAVGMLRTCPAGTYFDKELGLCDTKDQVPACTGKPRPPTTTPKPTSPRPTIKYPFDCSGKKDGWYEDPKKCSHHYWACVGGAATRAVCPGRTIYDSELGQCGYRHHIPKCGGVRPTTTTTEQP